MSTFVTGILMAQSPETPPRHHVSGRVYDRITRHFLGGAVVHAFPLDSATSSIYTTMTDSLGRYDFAALPEGRFALEFEHDAIDVLGIKPPIRSILIPADDTVDLATPAGSIVRSQVCKTNDPGALLLGRVTRAAGGTPATGAVVAARWSELTVVKKKLQSVDREARAIADSTGRYQLCGVPADGPTTVGVSDSGFYPIDLELIVPAGDAARQDFRLAAPGSSDHASTIQLDVRGDSGNALLSGNAEIDALALNAVVDSGHATISGVPAGTWLMVVRAIGFEPKAVAIDASGSTTHATVDLARIPFVLDSVLVKATGAPHDSAVVAGIKFRLRTANGTYIAADNLAVRNSIEASDGIAAATGFVWKGKTSVTARPYSRGFVLADCNSLPTGDTVLQSGNKTVAIYLDGSRVPGGLEMINRMVPPSDILAIEAYPDVISAPFLWRTNDACAVIAFWTKRKPGKKR
jgi:hypothetical protein